MGEQEGRGGYGIMGKNSKGWRSAICGVLGTLYLRTVRVVVFVFQNVFEIYRCGSMNEAEIVPRRLRKLNSIN